MKFNFVINLKNLIKIGNPALFANEKYMKKMKEKQLPRGFWTLVRLEGVLYEEKGQRM